MTHCLFLVLPQDYQKLPLNTGRLQTSSLACKTVKSEDVSFPLN